MKKALRDFAKRQMKNTYILWKLYDFYFFLHNKASLRKYGGISRSALNTQTLPTLENPMSQMVTASQCFEPAYKEWCRTMRSPARMNRKQWEFVYVLEVLRKNGCLNGVKRGLGFGCGQEPLPAIMARYGCDIVATDLDFLSAKEQGWVDTEQHSAYLEALNPFKLCPDEDFFRRVSFRTVDMNNIPEDLTGFDFLWSSCAFEHLGSLEHGLAFVRNAMHCLKPGGVAVHTTEFNLSSDDDTINESSLSVFRKQDMLRLASDLAKQGHDVAPFNWESGVLSVDDHIDLPPFASSPHLKLMLGKYVCTSIGIIIRKRN